MPEKKLKIEAQGHEIAILAYENQNDFISLTDIARQKNKERTDIVILNWLRNRNTIEFLGLWEKMYNPNFNPIEFDRVKNDSACKCFYTIT